MKFIVMLDTFTLSAGKHARRRLVLFPWLWLAWNHGVGSVCSILVLYHYSLLVTSRVPMVAKHIIK